jgi:hypothetical protein
MRALAPAAAFRESWRLFRLRPLATLALGLALLTSLVAVCCGLGVVAAPWFLCELFAVQIALGSGERPARTRAWLWAGFAQMLAVLVLCVVVGLTLVSVGPDIVLGGPGVEPQRVAARVAHSLAVWAVAGSLALALTVYFEHAPALLLDRGGSLGSALLESARLVADSGVLRTWFTSGVAHALALGPIVLGLTVAAAFGTLASTVTWALALLPLAALAIALGQGMVVASYLAVREPTEEALRRPPRAAVSASRALLWGALLGCVLTGPVAVSGALLRPSLPRPTPRDTAGELLLSLDASSAETVRFIPDSAIQLRVTKRRLIIDLGDGGGAGTIPLPRGELAKVRVRRVARVDGMAQDEPVLFGSPYALDVRFADGRSVTTWIDDAGVRLDDSLERRLAALLPPWAIAALAGCLLWTALWVGLSLPAQGRLRRALAERWAAGQRGAEWDALHAQLRRGALRAALWLAPAALGSLAIGLWAALGRGTLPG